MRIALALAVASCLSTAGFAQVYDLPELARGQVISATAHGHAARIARQRRGPTSGQVEACRQKSRFRAEYGASHPKVRQLYRLCRGIGM